MSIRTRVKAFGEVAERTEVFEGSLAQEETPQHFIRNTGLKAFPVQLVDGTWRPEKDAAHGIEFGERDLIKVVEVLQQPL